MGETLWALTVCSPILKCNILQGFGQLWFSSIISPYWISYICSKVHGGHPGLYWDFQVGQALLKSPSVSEMWVGGLCEGLKCLISPSSQDPHCRISFFFFFPKVLPWPGSRSLTYSLFSWAWHESYRTQVIFGVLDVSAVWPLFWSLFFSLHADFCLIYQCNFPLLHLICSLPWVFAHYSSPLPYCLALASFFLWPVLWTLLPNPAVHGVAYLVEPTVTPQT